MEAEQVSSLDGAAAGSWGCQRGRGAGTGGRCHSAPLRLGWEAGGTGEGCCRAPSQGHGLARGREKPEPGDIQSWTTTQATRNEVCAVCHQNTGMFTSRRRSGGQKHANVPLTKHMSHLQEVLGREIPSEAIWATKGSIYHGEMRFPAEEQSP